MFDHVVATGFVYTFQSKMPEIIKMSLGLGFHAKNWQLSDVAFQEIVAISIF